MLRQAAFAIYFLLLQSSVFLISLNAGRIQQKTQLHPRISAFIFPTIVNLIFSNTIFRGIPSLLSTLISCLISLGIQVKMEKVRIFGITGSIATGKSTLTKLIKNNFKEIHIIDCDQISRNLRKKGQPGYKLLVGMLGDRAQEYLNPLTRQFDEEGRQKLNQYVFNNQQFRKKLTKKMGQKIMLRVFKQIFVNIITGRNIMAVDAPLLYQTKILQYICYPVAVVGCSQQTQVKRLMDRDEYTEQQARKRIASQMPLSQKRKKTKLYLTNQGSQQDLLNQFSAKIKRYLPRPGSTAFYSPNRQQKKPKNLQEEED